MRRQIRQERKLLTGALQVLTAPGHPKVSVTREVIAQKADTQHDGDITGGKHRRIHRDTGLMPRKAFVM